MRGFGLLLGCVLLAGCAAADEGTIEDVGEGSAALTHDQAVVQALVIETALLDDSNEREAITPEGAGWWLPRPLYQLLDRWGAAITKDCVETTRWLDRDRDGLPYDATTTLACYVKTDDAIVETTGTVRVVDLDDTTARAGYRIQFEGLTVNYRTPGVTEAKMLVLDGDALVQIDGEYGHGAFDRALQLVTYRHAPTYAMKTVVEMYTDTYYLPDWQVRRGDPFASGTVGMRGRWTVENNGRLDSLTVWTRPGLHFSRRCAIAAGEEPGFDRGALHAVSGTGLEMRLVFTRCAKWDVTYQIAGTAE